MTIYIDENSPPALAKGFNILQAPLNHDPKYGLREPIEVSSIKESFGKGVKDEEWIPKVSKDKDCVITQDYNIQRTRHQRELCTAQGLGMFYFKPPSKSGFTYWNIVNMLVKHWPEIVRKASREARPFSYSVTPRSTKLEKIS